MVPASKSTDMSNHELNTRFYRDYHPDLTLMSDGEARDHYRNHGRAEGRFPNAQSLISHIENGLGALPDDFDPVVYVAINKNLRELNTSWEAQLHYLEKGRKQQLPFRFEDISALDMDKSVDPSFYRDYYADLSGLSDEEAIQHFEMQGAKEGRFPNQPVFLSKFEREMRRLPVDFSPENYLAMNPELKQHLRKSWEPAFHYLRYGRWEGRSYTNSKITTYNSDILNRSLARIYDMPEVIIDHSRPPTINVLVPAFDFGSMSAGFFGVFQVALFIGRCGLNVRLVMYDEFDFDAAYMRSKLENYPGLEDLLDHVEVVYIGDRKEPLRVSASDNSVATVWYSAYLANKISHYVQDKKFLYLIQDYETVFYASSSHYAVAEESYSFNYSALFSSKSLQDFFLKQSIGAFAEDDRPEYIYFNNACSRSLEERDRFFARRSNPTVRRLVFYSRPVVNRNMFELGALALCEAYRQGAFKDQKWEFFGIGLGDAKIEFYDGNELKQLPRMNLKDYQDLISSFDVGLCLMASSHPSLLPFDLAGSGAVVVTNSFGVKDQAYFDTLIGGVIVTKPNLHSIVEGIIKAVSDCNDVEMRFNNASKMKFPTDWSQTFTDAHEEFVTKLFCNTLRTTDIMSTSLKSVTNQ